MEAFDMLVSAQVWRREYGYYGEIRGALREYRLDRAPALGLAVAWAPLIVAEDEFAGKLGFRASYARLLETESTIAQTSLATVGQQWQLGVRAGSVIAGFLEVGFGLDYGQHSFTVADTFLPDPVYRFARPGIYGRLSLWRLSLEASVGSRFLLDTGELQTPGWFPGVRGVGTDTEIAMSLRLIGPLALTGGVNWVRYPLAINAIEYDQNRNGVAVGLIDLYVSAWAGLGARF